MKSTASCAARKAVLFAELSGGSRGTATVVPPCLIHIITDVRTEGVGARSGMSTSPSSVSIILLFPQTNVGCTWPRPYMHPMISLISSIWYLSMYSLMP